MFAIVVTGGKQYKVRQDQLLKVEKIEAGIGDVVKFDRVLMVGEGENVTIGSPDVSGAVVEAEIVKQGRHPKIRIIKFRRRKHHMKHQGHRQWFTELKIKTISV